MSLSYADTSLPDFLCRPSLNYADQALTMQTKPPLCSKRASTIQHSFFNYNLCSRYKNGNGHNLYMQIFKFEGHLKFAKGFRMLKIERFRCSLIVISSYSKVFFGNHCCISHIIFKERFFSLRFNLFTFNEN